MGKISEDYMRVRVAFPIEAGKQLQALADAIHMDVPTLVRVMTSLQLQQWRMIVNPTLMLAGNAELQERFLAGLQETVPELDKALRVEDL